MSTAHRLRRLIGSETGALALALGLLLVAMVMPPVALPRATYDYVIVMDVTQSMNVEDYELDGAPVSRLDFARHAVRRALRALPCGSKVGFGAFAEYRTLLVLAPIEVCGNYSDLLAALDRLDGRMRWTNASEVAKGVFWAVRAARDVGGAPNVLFLSDGHEAPPLPPGDRPVFDDIKPGQIKGWLVGVGGYAPRPIPRTDTDGRRVGYWRAEDVKQRMEGGTSHEHLSALREPHLESLARQVGFDYTHLDGPDAVANTMRDDRFARRTPVPTQIAWLPAAAALLVLALRFWPDGWSRKRQRRPVAAD